MALLDTGDQETEEPPPVIQFKQSPYSERSKSEYFDLYVNEKEDDSPDRFKVTFDIEKILHDSPHRQYVLIHPIAKKNVQFVAEITKADFFQSAHHSEDNYLDRVELLRGISHRNLPQALDLIDFKGGYQLIMEYVDGQKLDSYLRTKPMIDFQEVLLIIITILKTVEYLHENGIVHNNLKVDNILIDTGFSMSSVHHLKVLGSSKVHQVQKRSPNIGRPSMNRNTDIFSAPETSTTDFSLPVDMYSIGLIIYYIFVRRFPDSVGEISFDHQIWGNKVMKKFDLQKLVESLILPNPEDRPTISTVLYKFNKFLTAEVHNFNLKSS